MVKFDKLIKLIDDIPIDDEYYLKIDHDKFVSDFYKYHEYFTEKEIYELKKIW